MRELLRTTNLVRLSFLEAQLRSQQIEVEIFDGGISALEAGISVFPRRIMVDDRDFPAARRLIEELGEEEGASWRD